MQERRRCGQTDDCMQLNTTAKGFVANAIHGARDSDGGQHLAAAERIFVNLRYAFGEIDCLESGTIVERRLADAGHRGWESDLREAAAIGKRTNTYGRHTARDSDAGQTLASVERAVCDDLYAGRDSELAFPFSGHEHKHGIIE